MRYVQDAAPRYVFVIEDTASMNLQVGWAGVERRSWDLDAELMSESMTREVDNQMAFYMYV